MAAGFHALYYDRTVRPATADRPAAGIDRRRVVVAALVVTAAVAGAAAVRTADVQPAREVEPLPEDPVDAYAVAVENTVTASHRRMLYSENESDDRGAVAFSRAGVDRRDRQRYSYFGNRALGNPVVGGFMGEGTLALYNGGGRGEGILARTTENWTVLTAPGYYLVGARPRAADALPDPGADWSVVAANVSTVALRVDDPEAIRAAYAPGSVAGMGENMTDDSHLTVYVDRERGVVDRAVVDVHSRATGRNFHHVLRVTDIGADLERPAAIGSRGPVAWALDALYY